MTGRPSKTGKGIVSVSSTQYSYLPAYRVVALGGPVAPGGPEFTPSEYPDFRGK